MPEDVDLRYVQSPGHLVWNPDRGLPQFVHGTRETAEAEARRLSVKNAGALFFVMSPVSAVLHETQPALLPHIAKVAS